MEVTSFFDTYVPVHQTTRRHISEDWNLNPSLCQRCVVRRVSGSFNSRWRELDKPLQC